MYYFNISYIKLYLLMFSCIYKWRHPTTYRLEEVLSEQVPEDHGASMFNGEQVNDHIEQDDHIDNVVEEDGTNTLIHDSFNVRMDDDVDVDN